MHKSDQIVSNNIKPLYIGPRPENVPAELKALRQWLLWRAEWTGTRWAKVPYRADGGGRASSTDPGTWTGFDAAMKAYYSRRGLDGVGFVFAAGGGLAGVDLDDCIIDGVLTDEARAVVEECNSYTELSVSGSGLHVIVRGVTPSGRGRRTGHIEAYPQSHYFTVSGCLWGPLRPIRDAQDVIDRLCARPAPAKSAHRTGQACPDDRELLRKAALAKNGFKFARLWSGDTSDYGDDHSRADLALLAILMYWTRGDEDRADRLFRQSGLNRDKWTEREDYRERSFARLRMENTR